MANKFALCIMVLHCVVALDIFKMEFEMILIFSFLQSCTENYGEEKFKSIKNWFLFFNGLRKFTSLGQNPTCGISV